ncbi:NEQ283 [Nanoarchaeum equitans Kin4-M]|uniref:NEQ283 n=1 Tax=Nanoarchaeum equitans (strain Kin4-M) TaxID=228908 RepID=Q74MT6_NANEQ|nr:NEQ283 [Nanoarchaeum equitans Kin4-M]
MKMDKLKYKVLDTIKRYSLFSPNEKLLLAISGGKDSVTLLDILYNLNYKFDLYFIDLGIKGFSDISEKIVESLSKEYGLNLYIDRVADYGITIKPIGKMPACAVCGIVKRYLMNKFAYEKDYTLITAHNFDDIIAFALANLFSGNYEYLLKIRPKNERYYKLAKKVKPLFFVREKETLQYVKEKNLPYVNIECPLRRKNTQDRYKNIANEFEKIFPGFKKNFIKALLYYNTRVPEPKPKNYCKICGYPSKGEVCSFCRIRNALSRHNK